ncbi:MAG TPA: inositol monophosphatase [Aminobacterium sp.]|uniref:inositol monophosphatase family protein n=1 Tax=Aminobacterium TaxID=81466 RepID=UPI000ECDABC3|nr:inositol monophosphatase family protein [Aminobacterium sp. UBA4834]HCA41514.1 inositol monophosphatase [Aminobacterium sp.]
MVIDVLSASLISLLKEAGDIIKERKSTYIARRRSLSDYTTATDIEVERFIVSYLQKLSPESVIVAEESSLSRDKAQLCNKAFVLDPIDGTVNFYHNYPAFAISLAYVERGTVQRSYIYDPINEEFFSAVRGKGAFLNGTPIHVSTTSTLSESLVGFGTAYNKELGKKEISLVMKVYEQCHDVRRRGAASLDVAYVACGRLDSYLEMDLKPWDFYGGILLLEEAGGLVTDWSGNSIQGLGNQDILCSNGFIHNEMLAIVEGNRSLIQ